MTAKTLLLLRHAKSDWDDTTLDDFDRPLAERGRLAAPAMGREIARRGWVPDAALASSAVRTRQTWELVAAELRRAVPVNYDRAIYEAPAGRILDALRKTPDAVTTLLVVGHNPGLEVLSELLAAPDSDHDALARLTGKFPTAGLARFAFNGSWARLDSGGARLEGFVKPKDLTYSASRSFRFAP